MNLSKLSITLMTLALAFLVGCASAPPSTTAPRGRLAASKSTEPCVPTDNVPRITVEELKKLMDDGADIVVVDTLYPYWYKRGHIKGAINFPWAETIKEPTILPRNKLLALYCDCECEETSADVGEQLIKDWGYTNVKVLKGGWVQWVKLGYPTEKGLKK